MFSFKSYIERKVNAKVYSCPSCVSNIFFINTAAKQSPKHEKQMI